MKKIAWITDTTATLSKDFIEKHNIHVVPLQIMFGEESFLEEVNMTTKEFYDKTTTSKESPTSSQPAIGTFVELYEKLKEEYEFGIAIHATSELSGTYNASVQAAEIAGFHLLPVDSRIGSYPLIKMMELGLRLEEEGVEPADIASKINELAKNAELYLLPADLEQLRKSGRVTASQALFGALLGVNLVVKFEDGKVVLDKKIRTQKKVKSYMFEVIERAAAESDEVCIVHADDEERANAWKLEVEALYPTLRVSTLILCPVAGVHTGKGSMCVSWIKNK